MATQYTAGITQGQVWTAAIANQIGAAWETWTPTVVQGTTTFTTTISYARYCRIQKTVMAVFGLTIASGTGQLNQSLTCTLPLAINNLNQGVGSAWVYDTSTVTSYGAVCNVASTTAINFVGDWSGGANFGITPAIQFTTSDQLRGFIVYETTA